MTVPLSGPHGDNRKPRTTARFGSRGAGALPTEASGRSVRAPPSRDRHDVLDGVQGTLAFGLERVDGGRRADP